MASFAAEPMDVLPIFVNRSGAPYSKDTPGDDFRAVRGNVSDPRRNRQLQDFRRSGAIEALERTARQAVFEHLIGLEQFPSAGPKFPNVVQQKAKLLK